MKSTALLILIGLTLCCAVSWGQEIYQWTDEKGSPHYTDDISQVPERYRDQVKKKNIPKEPSPLPPPPINTKDKDRIPASVPERKDILGEEWWRTKVK
jgi:hypothetical protein